jgi:glycosyltransferase involved in cell wall biosynthesis
MPAYNAARTIGVALESVLAQTFTDFEVIVVDDGSTDETGIIANNLDSRVRCVQQDNAGPYVARNRGLHECRADLIALLDADDIWCPDKLRRQVDFMHRAPNVGISYTAAWRVDENLAKLSYIPARTYDDYGKALLLHSGILGGGCSAAMIRRDLIRSSGGFSSAYTQSGDWEYWLRLSRLTDFGPIDEPLVLYRLTAGSVSSNVERLEHSVMTILDEFYRGEVPEDYRRLRRRVYSNHWMILAGSYFQDGKPLDAIRCAVRSLILHPANALRPAGLPLRWIRRRRGIVTLDN